MTHDHLDDLLPYYVRGTLNADERAAVEAHLATCAHCQAELSAWQDIGAAADRRGRKQAASLPSLVIPQTPSLRHRRLQRTEKETAMHTRTLNLPTAAPPARPVSPYLTAVLALAAALLVAVVFIFNLNDPDDPAVFVASPSALQGDAALTAYDYLVQDGRFSIMTAIIDDYFWLADALQNVDDVTVFAIPDADFEALLARGDLFPPAQIPDTGVMDTEIGVNGFPSADILRALVATNLVLNERISLERLVTELSFGNDWRVGDFSFRYYVTAALDDTGDLLLNGRARLLETDIDVANGIVHVVDNTLYADPYFIEPDEMAYTVYDLLVQNSVCAWSDEGLLFAGCAELVIDAEATADPEGTYELVYNFVQFAVMAQSSLYVRDVLNGPCCSTVFIPLDDAILAAMATFNQELADIPGWQREAFVMQHVVSGLWSTDLLRRSGEARAIWQADDVNYNVTISAELTDADAGDDVAALLLNDRARIVFGDIITANGIIHIIDVPLVPEETFLVP